MIDVNVDHQLGACSAGVVIDMTTSLLMDICSSEVSTAHRTWKTHENHPFHPISSFFGGQFHVASVSSRSVLHLRRDLSFISRRSGRDRGTHGAREELSEARLEPNGGSTAKRAVASVPRSSATRAVVGGRWTVCSSKKRGLVIVKQILFIAHSDHVQRC